MKTTVFCLVLALLAGCSSSLPPLRTVQKVDLNRFMGPWYIIACIPTFIETDSYNGVESYTLKPDGTVDTVFTFREGGFDGPQKRYNPHGFIVDRVNNSTWGMQFIWPIKAEYLITHLTPEYTLTVIGRSKRDYVWIMARTPRIPEEEYGKLVQDLAVQGYDVSKLRKTPQRWPEAGSPTR